MEKFSDEKLVLGVKKQDNTILLYIYKTFYPRVQRFVLLNSGTEFDAKDVFQEGIIAVYKKIISAEFALDKDFGSYLLGTCRFIWYKMLRDSQISQRNLEDYKAQNEECQQTDDLDEQLQESIYRKHFFSLTEDCQRVIKYAADGLDNDQIALKMGYKNVQIAYNKKYKCKELLIKLIKGDSRLNE